MLHYPGTTDMFPLPFISTLSKECETNWYQNGTDTSGFASAPYISSNRAYYYPFYVGVDVVVKRLWWNNGTTASTNKFQMAIYNEDLSKAMVVGSQITASGASQLQFDDIADTVLPAGKYWLAIWCNGTTATLVRKVPGVGGPGYLQENSLTGGLADPPAAPAAVANAYYPVIGFDIRGTP